MAAQQQQRNEVAVVNLLTLGQVMRLFGKRSKMTLHNWRRYKGFPTIIIPSPTKDNVRFDAEAVLEWAKRHNKEIVNPEVLHENQTKFVEDDRFTRDQLVYCELFLDEDDDEDD